MTQEPLKTYAIRTAMKNPRLSKLILDAAKSPVGSSKRDQVNNIIGTIYTASLNKIQKYAPLASVNTNSESDGQGGPVNTQPTPAPVPVYSLKPVNLKSKNIFGSSNQPDGQGGIFDNRFSSAVGDVFKVEKALPGALYDTYNDAMDSASNYYDTNIAPTVGKIALTPLLGIAAGTEAGARGAANILNYTFGNPKNPANNFDPSSFDLGNTLGVNVLSDLWPTPNNSVAGSQIQPRGAEKPVFTSTPTPLIPPEIKASQAAANTGNTTYQNPYNSASTQSSSQTYPGGAGPSYAELAAGTYNADGSYNPTGNELQDYLMTSYGKGIGANAFALGVMADSKKLQELLPGTPANKLPVGASLAGQLSELADRLKQENNLDYVQNKLTQAVTSGQTITDDAEAYIRGKDEFLNSVDQMLTKANDQQLHSSMGADPFYQKSMQQYTNYLTILKGRATQRYTDYLNTAINYHNSQTTQLQNLYNSLAQKVNTEFQTQSAITTEQYNDIKQTLIDMYNNVAQRSGLLNMNSQDTINLYKSQADLTKTVLETASNNLTTSDARQALLNKFGITGIDVNAIGNGKTNSDQIDQKQIDYINTALTSNNGGTLSQAINNPSLQHYDSGVITNQYFINRGKEVEPAAAAGNLTSTYNTDRSNQEQVLGMISNELKNSNLTDQEKQEKIQNAATDLQNPVNKAYLAGIKKYLQDHEATIRTLISRMKGHSSYEEWKNAGTGFFGKGKTEGTKYIGNDDGQVSEDYADYLFKAIKSKQNTNASVDNWNLDDMAATIYGQLN